MRDNFEDEFPYCVWVPLERFSEVRRYLNTYYPYGYVIVNEGRESLSVHCLTKEIQAKVAFFFTP